MTTFPEEFSYLEKYINIDEPYEKKMMETIFPIISTKQFPLYFQRKYANLGYEPCTTKDSCRFTYDYITMNIVLDPESTIHPAEQSNDSGCFMSIGNNKIDIKIPQKELLLENINNIKSRYYPIFCDIFNSDPSDTSGHIVSVVFDKYEKTVIIVDSNGYYLRHNHDSFDNSDIEQLHLHLALRLTFNELGFSYIPLIEKNINTNINVRINVINNTKQIGKCAQWTFIMCELLMNSDHNTSPYDILQKITNSTYLQRQQLVDTYQVNLYEQIKDIFDIEKKYKSHMLNKALRKNQNK